MPITESYPLTYGDIKLQLIILAQLDAVGNLQYVRLPICRIRTTGNHPLGDEKKKLPLLRHRERWRHQAWQLTVTWLNKQSLSFRQASPAFPKELELLDAKADFLRWDAESYSYIAI